MENPYRVTSSSIVDNATPSRMRWVALVVGVFCAALAALVPTVAVPAFEDVFNSFGGQLPWATRLMIQYYPLAWALPFLVVLAFALWPTVSRRTSLALMIGVTSLPLVALFSMWVLYLPIYQLSASH